MKSTGNRVTLHMLTSHCHDDARPGKYAMKSLKVMAATENFLAMPDDVKKCQIEVKEDCKSRRYVEEVQKECGCIPWALSSAALPEYKIQCNKSYNRYCKSESIELNYDLVII